jgi:L,D-transpeptidase YcbB
MKLNQYKASSIKFWMKLSFLVAIIITSCVPEKEKITIIKETTPQNIELEISNQLTYFLDSDTILKVDSIPLICYRFFKANYSTKLLWFSNTKLNANGDSLLNLIENSLYLGLNKNAYCLSSIKNHIQLIHEHKDSINITSLIKADLFLSNSYYLIGAHLNKGRFNSDSLLLTTNFTKLNHGWDSILASGYKTNNLRAAFDSLEPKHKQYHLLKKELASILNDSSLYQFNAVDFDNDSDLYQKHDLIISTLIQQNFYDTLSIKNDSVKLSKALTKFQKKWFIQPDGKFGNQTKQALSYDREKIIKQLCMTMERWRWETEFPDKYALVNIPSFNLTVFEQDTIVLQSPIVCGKPETQTPILKSKINYMLIYPYWNVPTSIATKEILPAVQKDTSYLRRKNIEVLGKNDRVIDYSKINWKKYSEDYLPVRFRQRIGEENSLGIVKFNFNNPFGVYLHDTNSKRYFKTNARAQSHGCIRLEKYIEFADFLIRDDSTHYTHDSLTKYFATQQQRKIALRQPLPIYIRYFTTEADSNGLKIYLDIYKKDEEMMKLIYK